MPFAVHTSDWPAFLQGFAGIVVASFALVLTDMAAKLLLRLPPFKDMSVRGRKILGAAGVFGALLLFIVAGIHEQETLVIAGIFVGITSFLFAVRADRS